MTVGEVIDGLAGVDRSLPCFLPDLNGSPVDMAAVVTVTTMVLTERGAARVAGIAFLRHEHLSTMVLKPNA